MEEINGKGDTNKMTQNINQVLQRNHNRHHTAIQTEARNLCMMDVLCNK